MSLWTKKTPNSRSDVIVHTEILDLMSSLVDRSLVIRDDSSGRFRLLETVRQFGIEELVERGEADGTRDRHLRCFVQLAELAEPELTGASQQEWMERLDAEHDNIRSALAWSSQDERNSEHAIRICGAVVRYWMSRGHHREGLSTCRSGLKTAGKNGSLRVRARALNAAGILAACQRDLLSARKMFGEYLAIQRELGYQPGIAAALGNLGLIARDTGGFSEADALFSECLEISRELKNRWAIGNTLCNLGLVAVELGDLERAQSLQREGLAVRKSIKDQRGIGFSLSALGMVALERADTCSSRLYLRQGLAILFEFGDLMGMAEVLEVFACLETEDSNPHRAARLWGIAEQIREETGCPMSPTEEKRSDRYATRAKDALGEIAFDSARLDGRQMKSEARLQYALEDTV